MSNYIDDGEKFVARLGGTYAPGVKKAAKSLELTDRRMYYSAPAEVGKTTRITSSVIDVSDVSAVTYDCERPRGKFGLGIFLLVMSLVGGIVWGVIGYVKKEGAPMLCDNMAYAQKTQGNDCFGRIPRTDSANSFLRNNRR